MYTSGCKGYYTQGKLTVLQGSTVLKSTTVSDQLGYGFLHFTPMNSGTYTIRFAPQWTNTDVRDYTIQVYAKEAVTIKDSAGKTSYDTTTVYNSDSTTTTTTDPTPTPQPDPTPTPTPTDTSSLATDLQKAISEAAASSTKYPYTDGSWYYIKKGWFNTLEYYFEFGVPNNYYNVDVSVTLTAFNTVMAKTTSTPIVTINNSDGSVSLKNQCVIQPKISGTKCSYLVHAEQKINWAWTLNTWSYA